MSPIPEAQPSAPNPATETAPLEVFCSRHFTGCLADERLSLAFTTYQAGKPFLIALRRSERSVTPRKPARMAAQPTLPIAVGTDTTQ